MLEKVYKQIDIEKISANENQPRTVFDDEKIEELAASIKENGLIQPIIVRKYNRGYQIVAGERRYRASKLAGLKTVPCVIKDIDDKQVILRDNAEKPFRFLISAQIIDQPPAHHEGPL